MPESSGKSTEPTLVVDMGTYATAVGLLVAGQIHIVPDPVSGAPRWPSAACFDGERLVVGAAAEELRDALPGHYTPAVRRAIDSGTPVRLGPQQITGPELATSYLRAVAAQAERVYGGRIGRLALTVPPGYQPPDPRRDAMLAVAANAGFPAAELVSDSVAAALDPAAGLGLPDNALALVCDLGETWTVALLQFHGGGATQLAQETSGAGRDVDRLLVQDLRLSLGAVVEPLLAQSGEAGVRAYYQVSSFVRRLKHELAATERAGGRLPGPGTPYQLTRAELERAAEPALRWLVASCRAVVAQARVAVPDVAAVVLAGGCSRLPVAHMMIQTGLERPVVQAADPELAAVRGAARWAAGAEQRRLTPERPRWRVEPLSWKLPDGQGRIVRWLVAEGQPYPAGAALAQVRGADGRVYELAADREGVLLEHRLPAGATVASAAVAATTQVATALAGGELTRRHQHRSDGDWLLTPDRTLLVEWTGHGGTMRARDIRSGSAVAEIRPPLGQAGQHGGRPCVGPDGRLAFVAWDGEGHLTVWDALSGAVLAKFKAPDQPARVLVDEIRWRVVVESAKRMRVGRYQRDTATVWDLRTGRLVEELVGEDLQRRYVGFTARTAADAFAAEATSPDGRLHAVAAAAGPGVVVVREASSGQEVLRAETPGDGDRPAPPPRVGFSADGRHLLLHWRSAAGGWVDVWDVTPAT